MERREVLGFLGATSLAGTARAQPATRVHRIAYLSGGTQSSGRLLLDAYVRRLEALGYDGRNVLIETRFAGGKFDQLPALATELLAWGPHVVVAHSTPAALAAKAATASIPVIFVGVADAQGVGLVSNLARPGGNVTGVTNISAELAGKRLQILKELVPDATKIAVMINPDDQNASLQMQSASKVSAELGVQLAPILDIRSRADLEPAFRSAVEARAHGALRMVDPLSRALARDTIDLANKFRLPVIYAFRELVEEGGLVSFGASLIDEYGQVANYTTRILQGTKPDDLPVARPVRFELVISLKAARAIQLDIPRMTLARADEIID
jgi:putative ABC transport system substrate-binding protein